MPYGKHFRYPPKNSFKTSGCMLYYGPAVKNYRGLTWEQLMLRQKEINKIKRYFNPSQKKLNLGNNYKYDRSDKLISYLLRKDNRIGIVMYYFDVKYDSKVNDGGQKYFKTKKNLSKVATSPSKNSQPQPISQSISQPVSQHQNGSEYLETYSKKTYNMEIIDTPQRLGEHNCLFHSFLRVSRDGPISALIKDKEVYDLRLDIINWIGYNYANNNYDIRTELRNRGYSSFEDYSRVMKDESTLAGDLELFVLTRIFDVQIVIHQLDLNGRHYSTTFNREACYFIDLIYQNFHYKGGIRYLQ